MRIHLTDRLGSEPILSVSVNLMATVTETGTGTVRVNGPLTLNGTKLLVTEQILCRLRLRHIFSLITSYYCYYSLFSSLAAIINLTPSISSWTESGVLWFPWWPVVTVTVVATLQTARYFYDAIFHRNHPCSAFNVFFSLAPISYFYSSTTFRLLLRVGLRLWMMQLIVVM